jgi:integrase
MHLWELSKESETAKIILFYIYTGLRYSELFELQEENCYPDHLEIVKAKTKAGVRVVPLSDKAKSLLPIQRVPEYGVFNRYFKEFLPGHHVHDTRHTFTTLLAQAGVDERTIKAIIGHSAKDVTDHYTHIELSVMLEAVNKI